MSAEGPQWGEAREGPVWPPAGVLAYFTPCWCCIPITSYQGPVQCCWMRFLAVRGWPTDFVPFSIPSRQSKRTYTQIFLGRRVGPTSGSLLSFIPLRMGPLASRDSPKSVCYSEEWRHMVQYSATSKSTNISLSLSCADQRSRVVKHTASSIGLSRVRTPLGYPKN